MPLQNLHSLFTGPWYIHHGFAQSHIPLAIGILQGKISLSEEGKEKPIISFQAASGNGSKGSSGKQVAIVNIKSAIVKYTQGHWGPVGTKTITRHLERLAMDDSIIGIVLDIDSGGGQVYGTPEFYDYLLAYPKPLVAYTDGMMCSAAYYIGSATDYIIANKRAEHIGSIGALASFVDFNGILEHFGAKVHTIYADQSSEKNKAYREVLEGNYKTYIKEDLNPIVETFITDMKASRPKISEDVFKGATYPGPVALKKGLVDSLGTLGDAIEKVFSIHQSKSTNTNTEMSKPNSYPNLEAALELDAPLAVNDNGSYLNEDQKLAIENALSANATTIKTAQEAQAKAEADLQAANEAHAAALEKAEASNTAAVAALRAAATLAGAEDLAEDASTEDIQAALTAQINVLNAKPGATHTANASNDEQEGNEHAYLDFDNSIYSQLK